MHLSATATLSMTGIGGEVEDFSSLASKCLEQCIHALVFMFLSSPYALTILVEDNIVAVEERLA